MFKPKKQKVEEVEEEYEEEEEDDVPTPPKRKVVRKPVVKERVAEEVEEEYEDEEEEDDVPVKRPQQQNQITPQELIDMIEGHLARANNLLSILKNYK